jgi:transposase
MQGLTAEGVRRRTARRERVRVLYGDGSTIRAIACELGVSDPTVIKDVNALAEAGELRKRARGEATVAAVQRWWDSEEGRQERERRSEKLRSAPPIERRCEWCGESFTMSAARARREPGRFCSHACLGAWRGREALEVLRAGRRQASDLLAEAKRAGLMDQAGLGKALPLGLTRSQAAVSGHLSAACIEPVCAVLGTSLYGTDELNQLEDHLRVESDGRSRRFNADSYERAVMRNTWTGRRHGDLAKQKEAGRLNAVLVNPRAEDRRKRSHDDELEAAIQERAAKGHSERQIAQSLHISPSRVHRYLHRREPPPSRLEEIVQLLEARPWRTAREIASAARTDQHLVPRILTQHPELFQARSGEQAKALGRSPSAVLWALK